MKSATFKALLHTLYVKHGLSSLTLFPCVSLIVTIPVKFNQTTYSVVEGEKSVSITLVAAADHDFLFSVTVSTRDGTASCEGQTAVYGQTCLIYIAHNFLCNSISFVHLVITVNC